MDRFRKYVFLFINLVCIAFLTCIFAINIKYVFFVNNKPLLLLAELLLCLFLFLVTYFVILKFNIKRAEFIFFLILTTVTIRLLWLFAVPTLPNNDFLAYQSYANNIALGFFNAYDPSYAVFPFKIGYPMVLSVLYRLFGTNLLLAKIFNMLLSAILGLQIYLLASKLFSEKAGRISALLYVFWPAQIMFSSVLASEHLFIVLFLFTIQVFMLIFDNKSMNKNIAIAAATGILLTLTQFIRPISLLLFPVFFFYLIFYIKIDTKAVRYDVLKKLSLILIISVSYFGSLFLLNSFLYPKTQINIMHSSSGYNLLVGSNYKYSGMANEEDSKILEEFNYDFEKIHATAEDRALERIKSNPGDMLKLIVKKLNIQWEGESYGYYWSTISLSHENSVTNMIKSYGSVFYGLSAVFFLVIIAFYVLGCLLMFKDYKYKAIIPNLIFLGLFASYILFEVQSRYHFPATPVFIIIAGYGAEKVFSLLAEKYSLKTYNLERASLLRGAACMAAAVLILFAGLKISGFSKAQLTETGLMEYKITYNKQALVFNTEPILVKNVLHVSLLEFCKAVSLEYEFNKANGEVQVHSGGNSVLFTENSSVVIQNGKETSLKDPIPASRDNILVPLRFLSEAFNIKVGFDAGTNSIILEK